MKIYFSQWSLAPREICSLHVPLRDWLSGPKFQISCHWETVSATERLAISMNIVFTKTMCDLFQSVEPCSERYMIASHATERHTCWLHMLHEIWTDSDCICYMKSEQTLTAYVTGAWNLNTDWDCISMNIVFTEIMWDLFESVEFCSERHDRFVCHERECVDWKRPYESDSEPPDLCMHVCMYVCVCMWMCWLEAPVWKWPQAPWCMYARMYVCVCVCMWMCCLEAPTLTLTLTLARM